MTAKMQSERFLLQENVHGTAIPDEATRSAIANMAGELATIATVALSVSAPDKRYEAAPATCHAHVHEQRSYTIQCY
jgi:hypothetical protein